MSEGDVSLIQDEDVLRRMWQQTEDLGKRKEIRAHMFKLREERLKNLYSEDGKNLQFTSTGGHTDSFADQCFQSLKSKEVRDSESPTREYNYKVTEADASNEGGWNVVSKNEISDDGNTVTKMTTAHTSGTKEIDGGNLSYAALNESQKSETNIEDDNSKFHSKHSSSKTMAKEQFVSEGEDGSKSVSTTSSVGTSHTTRSSSEKHEIVDQGASDDCTDFVSNIQQASNNEIRDQKRSETIVKSSSTLSTSSSIAANEAMNTDGELVSRKVEHPDEFTKVVTETRKLADGTMVTSTSRQTKGSWSSQSAKQRSDHYDSATAKSVSATEVVSSNKLIDSDDQVVSTDTIKEKKYSVKSHDDGELLANNETTVVHHETIELASNKNNIDEVHSKNDSSTVKSYEIEEIVPVNKVVLNNSYPKPEEVDNVGNTMYDKNTTGEYATTYQTDYTNKKISEDLSATHNAWASSLRSSNDTFVRGGSPSGGSVRSLRTSTSSLRSSISPEKKTSKDTSRKLSDNIHKTSNTKSNVRKTEYTDEYTKKKYSKSPSLSPERKSSSISPTRHQYPDLTGDGPFYLHSTADVSRNRNTPNRSHSTSPARNENRYSPSVSPSRIPQNTNRACSPPKYNYDSRTRSRESSPTTSVSDIEYVRNTQRSDKITDNSSSSSTPVKRKSSLKKTTTDTAESIASTTSLDSRSTYKKDNYGEHKYKPYTRSETYEERCRKILGMPDKKTLVEDAERNLSEILGSLPQEKPKEPASENIRELSEGSKSAELIRRSENSSDGAKRSIDSQNLVENLVDAEYIKIDTNGKVVSAETPKKLVERSIKESANSDFIESEKREISNQRTSRLSNTTSTTDKRKSSTGYVGERSPSPKKEVVRSNRSVSPKKGSVDTPKGAKEVLTNRPASPKKEVKDIKRSFSPPKKDKIENKRSISPEKSKMENKPSTPKVAAEPKRSVSPKKENSNIPRSSSPGKENFDTVNISCSTKDDKRSVSVKKDVTSIYKNTSSKKEVITNKESIKVNTSVKEVKDQLNNKNISSKTAVEQKKKDVTNRSLSPTKRNPSPQKLPTKKEINEKTIFYADKSPTINSTTNKKQEPTRTILTSQKYNIFKENKNQVVKKDEQIKKSNVSVKSNISQQTVNQKSLDSTQRNKTKVTTNIETEDDTKSKKKVLDTVKTPSNVSPKMQRSYTDTKKTSNVTNVDTKITRTASDIAMKPISKLEPTRVKSKPEINISRNSTSKSNTTYTNKTFSSSSKSNSSSVHTTNRLSSLKPGSNVSSERMVINYQRAKSSRDSSPDHICPIPVSVDSLNESGHLRLPDKVTEPDDYVRKKKIIHDIISESETGEDKIIELSDSDHENDTDDCLLSVNQKVSKFSKVSDIKDSTTKTDSQRYLQKKTVTDEVEEKLNTDDCLLSVSDKVSKFVTVSDDKKSYDNRFNSSITREFIRNEIGKELENDECLLSVNDKVSRFVSAAGKITEPIKLSENPKTTLKNIQIDESSNKLKKQSTEKSPGLVSKASKMINDVKTKFEQSDNIFNEIKLNVQKETIASQAKKSTAENVHLKSRSSPERSISPKQPTPEKNVLTLRSTETVKKAKALFENIANQENNDVSFSQKHATKLTDIGVYKNTDEPVSSKDIPQRKESRKSVEKENIYLESNLEEKNKEYTSKKTQKDERLSINTESKIDSSKRESYENTSETSKYSNNIPGNVKRDTEKSPEPYASTRRGSGKFGIELRRTSIEHTYNSERRRSSAIEAYLQSAIEEIFDLELLEQMLEKVTGYEQRRRVRSQIRIVKKNIENKQHSSTTQITRNEETRNVSPTRKSKVSVTNVEKSDITTTKKTSEGSMRSPSPTKQSKPASPDRKRSTSPVKKTVTKETEKISNVYENHTKENNEKYDSYIGSNLQIVKPKTSKVSEYTTAYLRKIGASNNLKSEYQPKVTHVKKEKEEKIVEQHTSHSRRTSSIKENTETIIVNSSNVNTTQISRSPSPKRVFDQSERSAPRSPSPDLKKPRGQGNTKSKTEYQTTFTQLKTKPVTKDAFSKSQKDKEDDRPEWAKTNVLRKTSTTENRTYSSKKIEEKNKTIRRSQSPSKNSRKPTDVITSSYGVGPTDEYGSPLFGIKALRKPSIPAQTQCEIKGTVITKEIHSVNGGEPEERVTITKYSSNPADLKSILNSKETTERNASYKDVKKTSQDRRQRQSVNSVTTANYSQGNPVSNVHKQMNQTRTVETRIEHPRTVRQGSVKCLTEKFIKNAVETNKAEKTSYPKAGLILRTSSFQDNGSGSNSSRSSTPGVARTNSNNSVNSGEMYTVEHHEEHSGTHSSFLDNRTKVTGVQDILTRMKNADIVIEDGDTTEDAEARALLNKFLGATALMHGMGGYIESKPQTKQYRQESRTVVTKTSTVSSSDVDDIWDERILRKLLEDSDDYEERRKIRARLRQVMAEQEACAQIVADAVEESSRESSLKQQPVSKPQQHSQTQQSNDKTSTVETETTTVQKVSTVSSKVNDGVKATKPASPFAKFRQLDKQNSQQSNPSSPKTPLTPTGGGGSSPLFKFTDPKLQSSASNIKERLLQWCRDKTQEYENVKLDNFSTSWSDGLAFCALIHHFLPNEFDYTKLDEKHRRHNFTLAFKVADEKAGIYPLLDVDDMVSMRKPDWKCVFTYVQAIHRRFKDED